MHLLKFTIAPKVIAKRAKATPGSVKKRLAEPRISTGLI